MIHSMGNCGGNAATGFAVVQVCELLRNSFDGVSARYSVTTHKGWYT